MGSPSPNYEKDTYRVKSAKGDVYVYAWKGKGAPRLPGAYGSPESIAAWLQAIEIRKLGDKATVAGLIADFKVQKRWLGTAPRKNYSDSTKDTYDRWFKRIEGTFGDLGLVGAELHGFRNDILQWRVQYEDRPRSADVAIEVFSVLLTFGIKEGRLALNRARGIEPIYESDRSSIIWFDRDLEALKAGASQEIYQAAKLAELTGIRKSDLLTLRWENLHPHLIALLTKKSGYKNRQTLPRYAELNAFLADLERRADTVLVNTRGEAWGSGFNASWQTAKDRAAKKIEDASERARFEELHFHDLRGTAATRFYVAGFNPSQIAQFMGWREGPVQVLIDRYVKEDELMMAYARQMENAGKNQPFEKNLEKNELKAA